MLPDTRPAKPIKRSDCRSTVAHQYRKSPAVDTLSQTTPVADAGIWNDLQRHVTSASSLPVFRSRQKTHLFRRSSTLTFVQCLRSNSAVSVLTPLSFISTFALPPYSATALPTEHARAPLGLLGRRSDFVELFTGSYPWSNTSSDSFRGKQLKTRNYLRIIKHTKRSKDASRLCAI